MIFFGAESGSDWALKEMQKGITTEQTMQVAGRMRNFGIIPEFSFVIGNPSDPERDTAETLGFIRKIKRLDPKSEIIIYHYTPVPQRGAMYGNIDGQIAFPTHARGVGDQAMDGLHPANRPQHSLAEAKDQAVD